MNNLKELYGQRSLIHQWIFAGQLEIRAYLPLHGVPVHARLLAASANIKVFVTEQQSPKVV